MQVTTADAIATRQLGARLAPLLHPGDFVALLGDLGAGKTQFVQGVAHGLAVPQEYRVTSPTYTILNIYPGRLPLYHFDLYRLSGPDEVIELGFEEYFYGSGACLVEWAERLGQQGPADQLLVSFRHVDEERREILFRATGTRSAGLLQQLAANENSF